MGNKPEYVIEVVTTQACNMACPGCFETALSGSRENIINDDRADLNNIKSVMSELINSDYIRSNWEGVKIDFWGGEPTIKLDMMMDLMLEFKDDPYVRFFCYTNGYSKSPYIKLVEFLDEHDLYDRVKLQISYDGELTGAYTRVDTCGAPTSSKALETFKYLADKGVSLSMKATTPAREFKNLSATWDDYEKLYREYKEYDNVDITFYTTIDAHSGNLLEYRDDFNEQWLEIAKKELKFYKEEGRFLNSWFGETSKAVCNAGASMVTIDVDGVVHNCHGTLYTDDKYEGFIGNVIDDNIVENIIDRSKQYRDIIKAGARPDKCEDCVASACMQCNSTNTVFSDKDEYMDKWLDVDAVPELCVLYKDFGIIGRAVNEKIKNMRG